MSLRELSKLDAPFKKLVCHSHERRPSPCLFCNDCNYGLLTSFHLAYFLHFGLDISGSETVIYTTKDSNGQESQRREIIVPITWELVAQAFEILESRIHKVQNAFPRLYSLCIVKLVTIPGILDSPYLPSKHKNDIVNFEQGFDIVDRQMWQTPGHTIFRPWYFPRYLLNHMDKYLRF